MWQGFRSADSMARREVLDLPAGPFWGPFSAACLDNMPILYGYSPLVIPKPPDWDTKHEVYAAEYAGNVAAVFHDPDALLDTPLIEGGDDTVYVAYSERMPERGTKVIIHLRPWQKGDGPETSQAPAKEPQDGAGSKQEEPQDEEPGDAPPKSGE